MITRIIKLSYNAKSLPLSAKILRHFAKVSLTQCSSSQLPDVVQKQLTGMVFIFHLINSLSHGKQPVKPKYTYQTLSRPRQLTTSDTSKKICKSGCYESLRTNSIPERNQHH